MINIERYNPDYRNLWNEFVESSKNGTFLFHRDYMDYHADKFTDSSYLFFRKGKLYALLSACISDHTLFSHAGLTYGGLVMNEKCTAEGILDVFDVLVRNLKENGLKRMVYKPVPHIYHRLPAEEDLYALFRHNARLTARNISSAADLKRPLKPAKDRTEALKRAAKAGIEVRASEDFDKFWEILENNLCRKYNASPTHSLEEIKCLHARFPDSIKLWAAYINNEMVGGTVCYITPKTIHTQYISATDIGKKSGAIDMLIIYLKDYHIPELYPDVAWFDLGTSNENGGKVLNESLIYQKEGFGCRGICYDTYEIDI